MLISAKRIHQAQNENAVSILAADPLLHHPCSSCIDDVVTEDKQQGKEQQDKEQQDEERS
ncbi:hypothetical protein [Streptomyces macrosporus]|uniref:hypothetical protein n=1 Tax=Streptomyces macrosporus TaxID=44032 RepID=UPI0031CDF1BF